MQSNGSLSFHSAKDNSIESRPYVPHDFVVAVEFRNGWAQRPKIGAMYGPKYVEQYRTEITEMYLFGEEDKKNKKSPAQMLEILFKNISQRVLFAIRKRHQDGNHQIANNPKKKQEGVSIGAKKKTADEVYTTFIKALASNQTDLLPAKALLLVKEKFPLENYPLRPCDKTIKSKFSNYKRSVKQKTTVVC